MSGREGWGLIVGTALTLALAAPAAAQGNPIAGERLAERQCAECHGIRAGSQSTNPKAPAFTAIAAEASVTDYSLRVFLRVPHATMPNLILKSEEIDDIVAYILSLRSKSGTPGSGGQLKER